MNQTTLQEELYFIIMWILTPFVTIVEGVISNIKYYQFAPNWKKKKKNKKILLMNSEQLFMY